jgi:hypothetical protein
MVISAHALALENVEFEGGITAVVQDTDESKVDGESNASLDLVTTIPLGPGAWTLYVEGSTTLDAGHVAAVFGEANADAGTALDRDDKGRLQVSELLYSLPVGTGELSAGLLDVTGFLDASEVANDETTQFLGSSFVNNPAVEFPDYTLGVVYAQVPESDGLGFIVTLLGSNGLGDNPNVSYSELVDVSEDGKGVFAGGELVTINGPGTYRLGAWLNTADHNELAGTSNDEENAGAYLSADWLFENFGVNLRLGVADEDVSEAASFVAVSAGYEYGTVTYGAGIAQTGVSDDVAGDVDDTTQIELYAGWDVRENLQITPSLMFLQNSGFDSSDSAFDSDVILGAVRTTFTF